MSWIKDSWQALPLAVLLLGTGCSTVLDTPPASSSGWSVDHHMHVRGAAATQAVLAMCRVLPQDCPPGPLSPIMSGAQAVGALDTAGLTQGVVLSMAYFVGMPELAGENFDLPAMVRAENEFVARQVATCPDRLIGFAGVAPLHASSVDEIRYWDRRGGLIGIKIHLSNNGFSFRREADVAALARVFETAGRARMPIIIHMRGLEPDYGEQDVRVFLQRVLPLARRIPVQIAHAGGWGGFDAATERALTAFADGITADPRNTRNLYFDLAGVGTRESTNERYARLASLVRRIGLRRFLMGSDWDALGAPERALRLARSSIPLSSEEWEAVLANRAPYMSLRRRNLATPAGRAVCAG